MIFVVLLVSETLYGRIPFFQPEAEETAHDGQSTSSPSSSPCSAAPSASRRRSCSWRSASASPRSPAASISASRATSCSARWSPMPSPTTPAARGSACWRPGCSGLVLGALHGYICKLPKVNDIAVGIAIMSFGTGLAFFFGKPYIQPHGAAPRRHPARRLVRQSRSSRRRCRSIRCSSSASCSPFAMWWALRQHALGPDRAHDRRQRRLGARHGRLGRSRALPRHRGRRLPRRRRRRLPVALLSGQLERGPVLRPGPDGGGAGHLRPLGPAALRLRGAAVRRRRRARPGAAVGRHHARATTSSTPPPTS